MSDDSDFESEHFKKLKKNIEIKKNKNRKSKQKSTHKSTVRNEKKTTPLQSVVPSTPSSKTTSTPVIEGPQVPITKVNVPVHAQPPPRAAPASVSSVSAFVDVDKPGPFSQLMSETSTSARNTRVKY